MQYGMRFLSESDIERIEAQSLLILSEIGIRVHNDRLRDQLRKAGIPVEDQMVRLPPQVVRWALDTAPREITLYGRNGDVMPLQPGHCYLVMGTGATSILDCGANHLRAITQEDVVNFARLSQTMDEISLGGGGGQAQDVAPGLEILRTVESLVLNNSKHHLAGPHDLASARTWYELVEIAGGDRDLRETPTLSFVVSTTSPLQLDYDSSQVLEYAAQRRLPFLASSCPMAGGTSPLALIGTVVLMVTEDLFLLTLAQLLNECSPVIWGGAAGIIDVRTGSLSYGAAERHLLLGANIEMAEHYALPHYVPSGSADSWCTGVQTGAEKMQCWMARRASDTIFGIGLGSLYNGLATSLEQVVIDVDLWQQANRVFRGLDTAELDEACDAIRRVGPGGNFLDDEQTLRLMRSSEIYFSDLANREGERGAGMLARAHDKVERILAAHQYVPPDAVVQEVSHYVQARSEELADG